MADPLATLDKALSQVDSCVLPGCGTEPFRFCYQEPEQHREQPVRFSVRIRDADYATEVSNMSRANILQQAGTSVLAQANQSTQNVLSLLR